MVFTLVLRLKTSDGHKLITAGVSWQNSLENEAHCGELLQLTFVADWNTKLGKNEDLKVSVRLYKTQEPSSVERVEQDG